MAVSHRIVDDVTYMAWTYAKNARWGNTQRKINMNTSSVKEKRKCKEGIDK